MRLLEAVAKAMNEAHEVTRAKALGDYSDTGATTKYPPMEDRKPTISVAADSSGPVTFEGVIDRQVREKGAGKGSIPMRQDTVRKYRRAVQEFTMFSGSSVLASTTAKEVDRWKLTMQDAEVTCPHSEGHS